MESRSVRTARFALSRRDTSRVVLASTLGLCFLWTARQARAEDARLQAASRPNSEQEAFFETKVGPLLGARGFRCQGEKEQKGGIRLDSAEALLGHNEDEALVKPGKPEASRVMEVIGYKDEPKMPPDGKLPDSDAQILREWIRRGAHFRSKQTASAIVRLSSPEGIVQAKKTLWSLQPIKLPIPPSVKDRSWVKNPIDQFILSKLEANGLTPSPSVDRR